MRVGEGMVCMGGGMGGGVVLRPEDNIEKVGI